MILPKIVFPELPPHLPARLERRLGSMRIERRQRLFQGLYVLASSGLPLSIELRKVLEANLGLAPGNSSVQRVFQVDLPESGLVIRQTPRFIRSNRISLLRLSPEGKQLCQSFGWNIAENEWERLIREHRGENLERHTVGVLVFCYQARLRDWNTELLPNVAAPLEPDVRLRKSSSWSLYVEFETAPHDKLEKWLKSYHFQGLVALATFTPALRRRLADECRQARANGIATDLHTLAQAASQGNPGSLWREHWCNWYDYETQRSILRWAAM